MDHIGTELEPSIMTWGEIWLGNLHICCLQPEYDLQLNLNCINPLLQKCGSQLSPDRVSMGTVWSEERQGQRNTAFYWLDITRGINHGGSLWRKVNTHYDRLFSTLGNWLCRSHPIVRYDVLIVQFMMHTIAVTSDGNHHASISVRLCTSLNCRSLWVKAFRHFCKM